MVEVHAGLDCWKMRGLSDYISSTELEEGLGAHMDHSLSAGR
jgi:hypothetical protein